MDIAGLGNKMVQTIKKYKFALILLGIGIVFMLIPGKKETAAVPSVSDSQEQIQDLGQQLSTILSAIDGAGDVKVLLTLKTGERIVYQQDVQSGTSGTQRIETVILTDANRNESGLVSYVEFPVYMGAVVVCQGADSAAVRLAIVQAVGTVTGLGADRISVQKMK